MSTREDLTAAVAALSSALELNTSLCPPFLTVLPVDGVAVSTLGVPFGSETVCASDPLAARLDELHMDLGEGPSWVAKRKRRPVLIADIQGQSTWPIFAEAIRSERVGAVYAFPMVIGSLSIGVVSMYKRARGSLGSEQIAVATQLTSIAARQVLRQGLSLRESRVDDDAKGLELSEYSRRIIHQATGMVLVQLDVTAADALLLIRAHAFARGRSVRDVAADIVERRLDLAQGPNGVEN